jgi:HSP20 family protein
MSNFVAFSPRTRRANSTSCASCGDFMVNMDVQKSDDGYHLQFELPGMEKDKIKIMVEDDVLTISGERTRPETKDSELLRSERKYGNFTRSFCLPENIDKSGISADYNNGLLDIVLPLKAEEKPRQIEVSIG